MLRQTELTSSTGSTTRSTRPDEALEVRVSVEPKAVGPEDTSSSGSDSSDLEEDSPDSTTDIGGEHRQISTSRSGIPLVDSLPANPDIQNRLASFFSQLAEQRANPSTVNDEIIEKALKSSDSGYEDDDEGDAGRRYVQLDLALGVLSEQEGDGEEDGDDVKVTSLTKEDELEASEPDNTANTLESLRKVRKASSDGRKAKKPKVEKVG